VAAIPEDICSDLSINRELLTVVGLPEAGGRGGDAGSLRAIGRELGIRYVLDGSIRGIADRLAVNLQLIDVGPGVHLWSEQFDIDITGTTDTRNEMTSRAALTLIQQFVEHFSRGLATVPPEDWTADDLVIRGMALLIRPIMALNSPDPNPQEALGYFEQALVAAPHSIQAKLGIARVLVLMGTLGQSPRGGSEEVRAEQLVAEILAVDGDNVSAHIAMGRIRQTQFRFKDSLEALNVALRLAPNYAPALTNSGLTLALLCRPHAAVPLLEKSLRLSPHGSFAPLSHAYLGLCHLLKGDAETAILSLRTARAINPRMSLTHLWLAAALGLNGELDEAAAVLKQAFAIHPDLLRDMLRDRLLAQRTIPEYVALFRKTIYAGLLRAGLPDVAAEADATNPQAVGNA
jgi:TolB-like protein